MCDEEIEPPVAVVIQECGPCVPQGLGRGYAGFPGHILERAIAVVPVQDVPAVVGDEEVGIAVAVVVAGAGALSPAMAHKARFRRDIGEGPVVVVAIQAVRGFFAPGKTSDPRSVDEEDIGPAVAVVVEQGHAASGRLQDEFLCGFASDDGPGCQAGRGGDIDVIGYILFGRPRRHQQPQYRGQDRESAAQCCFCSGFRGDAAWRSQGLRSPKAAGVSEAGPARPARRSFASFSRANLRPHSSALA